MIALEPLDALFRKVYNSYKSAIIILHSVLSVSFDKTANSALCPFLVTKQAASHSDGLIFQADSIQSERQILDLKYLGFPTLSDHRGAINVRVNVSSRAV